MRIEFVSNLMLVNLSYETPGEMAFIFKTIEEMRHEFHSVSGFHVVCTDDVLQSLDQRLRTYVESEPPPYEGGKITGQQVRVLVRESGIKSYVARRCGICHSALIYSFADGRAFFDSSCDCTRFYHPPEPCSWNELANGFNMNEKNPDYQARLLATWRGEKVEEFT